ncbi:MAG: 30S ribosomal protein S6 [Alphaproteobacteria bacterium]|jgi:small subunit ribosomal protein S6
MSYYENIFIARQDMSPAQVEAMADTYSALVEERGGKVMKREHWGLKTLAYRIKKNRKGHYVMLDVESDGETVVELERQMRLSEDVIRFLTVRLEEVTEAPSPMMSRRDRDDRRRPREDRPNDDAPRETSEVKEAKDEPVAEAAPAEETA